MMMKYLLNFLSPCISRKVALWLAVTIRGRELAGAPIRCSLTVYPKRTPLIKLSGIGSHCSNMEVELVLYAAVIFGAAVGTAKKRSG